MFNPLLSFVKMSVFKFYQINKILNKNTGFLITKRKITDIQIYIRNTKIGLEYKLLFEFKIISYICQVNLTVTLKK